MGRATAARRICRTLTTTRRVGGRASRGWHPLAKGGTAGGITIADGLPLHSPHGPRADEAAALSRIADVLALTERCCVQPEGRVETAAADVVWIVGRANGLFEAVYRQRLIKASAVPGAQRERGGQHGAKYRQLVHVRRLEHYSSPSAARSRSTSIPPRAASPAGKVSSSLMRSARRVGSSAACRGV